MTTKIIELITNENQYIQTIYLNNDIIKITSIYDIYTKIFQQSEL